MSPKREVKYEFTCNECGEQEVVTGEDLPPGWSELKLKHYSVLGNSHGYFCSLVCLVKKASAWYGEYVGEGENGH